MNSDKIIKLDELNIQYKKILDYYKKNINNELENWLIFDKVFDKPGKQGLVGLLKIKDDEDLQCVFKISQYINFLIEHESLVMKGLNNISYYCPHFCKYIGTVNSKIDPKCRKEGNPFRKKGKYNIEKQILLCENIKNSYKFYDHIKCKSIIKENVLFSTIKQVLLAITIAQNKKNFCHYDLHSQNIMLKKCNKDAVFLYVLDEENQFCVPTLGYYPIIIDFGFSYIKDMEDNPLWASLGHTHAGFTSDRYDWVSDPKLFLVTVSDEIKFFRNSKKSKKFRKIIKNIFSPLNISFKSGWDKNNKKSASDQVLKIIRNNNKKSNIFRKYDHYCIDILQTLIISPLEKQDIQNINISYKTFLDEWIKIENEISSSFYNLYILKGIIDIARILHPYYLDEKTRKISIIEFERGIFSVINSITSFCKPKNINFEKMFCSLLIFTKCLEGMLYEIMKKEMKIKQEQYKKLPLKSIEQIYGAIEVNIPNKYIYNENTNIFIINSKSENCDLFKIPKEYLDNINKLHTISIGTYIYDLYKKIQK